MGTSARWDGIFSRFNHSKYVYVLYLVPALPFGTPESEQLVGLPTHSYELPCFIIFLSSPSCFDVRLGFHMLVGDWDSNAPVVFWIDVLQ